MHHDIPFDIWTYILAAVDDTATLALCAQVCRMFCDAAAPSLYREIRVRHQDRGSDFRGNDAFAALEAHPHLRAYVRSVDHHVIDTELWRPFMQHAYEDEEAHATPWITFLPRLPNLTSYALNGVYEVSNALVAGIVDTLLQCSQLTDVKWLLEIHADALLIIKRLSTIRNIEFRHPDAGAMSEIGLSIREMYRLEGFHIKMADQLDLALTYQLIDSGNLGRLTRLTIGRGHPLSRGRLLCLLEGTPNLEDLNIFYDNFLHEAHSSSSFPGLARLRRLEVRHQGVGVVGQFSDMFTWATTVAARAPLEELTIAADDGRTCKYTTTIVEMASEYPALRSLSAPHVRLLSTQLLRILERCSGMEILTFLIESSSFKRFLEMAQPTHNVGRYLELPDLGKSTRTGMIARYRRS